MSDLISAAFPERLDLDPLPRQRPGLLGDDELAALLAAMRLRLVKAREQLLCLREAQGKAERLLASMLRDPGAYRGQTVTLRQIGQPGCGAYRVVPRWGIIGRMRGWWCVKLSSGCP